MANEQDLAKLYAEQLMKKDPGGVAPGTGPLLDYNQNPQFNTDLSDMTQPYAQSLMSGTGLGVEPGTGPLLDYQHPSMPSTDEEEQPEEHKEESTQKTEKKPALFSPENLALLRKHVPSDAQAMSDVLFPKDSDEESYKDVSKRQTIATLANQLGKAGEIIGSSIARTKPVAQQAFDQNIAQAGQIGAHYLQKKQMEEQDPNSTISQGYREYLKRYGVNVGEGASAAQIKSTILPMAFKEAEQKERLKQRDEEMRYKYSVLNEQKKQAKLQKEALQDQKKEKQTTDRIDRAGRLISGEIASSRGSFGKSANTYQAAEKIEALAGNLDPNNLDSRQIAEIARNLDGMLSSGQPTVSGLEKLIPKTYAGDSGKIAEYLTNIPKGSQQGAFVTRLMETVKREKELAHEQMVRAQQGILAPYNDLKDTPQMKNMLELRGLPADILSSKPKKIDTRTVGSEPPQGSTVLMSKDGVNYKQIPAERAEEARAHGYKERGQ